MTMPGNSELDPEEDTEVDANVSDVHLPDGLAWIRLTFIDVFGGGHSLQIPARLFPDAVRHGHPFDGSALEGRARLAEKDMRLWPDPATLHRVDGLVARAVCNVTTSDGRPWLGDPRTALQRIVEDLGELAEDYTAGAEIEFYFLDGIRPVDQAGYFNDAESVGIGLVREAADRLTDFGVLVEACHLEAGPGQYELDLAPHSPVALADALVLARRVIRGVATSAGLRATFMPRPLAGEAGSGLHLQQRVTGRLFNPNGTLDADGRAFVAGQLYHARGLSALASPTVNSYKRLASGPEAPSAVVWAHVNRGALIRLSTYRGKEASVEFRASDPLANPYLLLAGLLASGAHGLDKQLELPPPMEEDPASFDPAGSDSVRFEFLPRGLDEALDALLADDVLVDTFQDQLLSLLVDGRRAEVVAYETQITPWELERYLDEA
jgi:glutamine synthetase